jgi:hypothetical protein
MADSIKVEVEGRTFSVVGGGFREMLAAIKDIEGRTFDGQRRVWTLPCSLEVARETLEAEGYEVQGAGDQERSNLEEANAAQMFIRANADEIREMLKSLRADYERYSYRSTSQTKQQIGRRIGMLEHALRYAQSDLTKLDSQAIATLVKAGHVLKGEINNPSWATPSRERPR